LETKHTDDGIEIKDPQICPDAIASVVNIEVKGKGMDPNGHS
jgi:hypothetical protein